MCEEYWGNLQQDDCDHSWKVGRGRGVRGSVIHISEPGSSIKVTPCLRTFLFQIMIDDDSNELLT
jgi:hypothetical protein